MSLKKFVNDPSLYESFQKHLKEQIEQTQRGLEQASEVPVIYRCQGQISALRRLLSLREQVNTKE